MNKLTIASILVNLLLLSVLTYAGFRRLKNISQADNNIWKNRIVSFKEYPTEYGGIIFLGDSQTQFFEASELTHKIIQNRGVYGDTILGVQNRLSNVILNHPAKLFIEIGINDLIKSSHTVNENIEHYCSLLEKIGNESPNTHIYVQTLPPSDYRKANGKSVSNDVLVFNNLLKSYCLKKHLTVIDLYLAMKIGNKLNPLYDCGDHCHLTGYGYLKWRDMVSNSL